MSCLRCGNKVVEYDGLCASCRSDDRKAERVAAKPVKVYHMPKVSPKRKEENKTYAVLSAEHLKEHPDCQIKLIGCTNKGNVVHHAAKRGKNLNVKKYFRTACTFCHSEIEFKLSAKERREKGFLI